MQAATNEDIAAEAGMTIGAIYSNFAGKADLMAALMDDVAAHSSVRLEVRPTLRECLEALAQRIVEQVDDDPEAVDLSLEFALFAVREPEARERRLPHWDVEHDHHAGVLQRVAQISGEPLPADARELAEAVSHLAWSLMCSRRIMGPHVVTADSIHSALQLLARPAEHSRSS